MNTCYNKEKGNQIKNKNQLLNLKSRLVLRQLLNHLTIHKLYCFMKYNKNMQKIINLNINDYKEFSGKFSTIEIEIIPKENAYGRFIYFNDNEEKYYHIYFNDNEKEAKRRYFDEKDKVSMIRVLIDYKINSFYRLFSHCECIESINFKTFHRINITNMSEMFESCTSLKKINFLYFNGINFSNVTNMRRMFFECI